MYEAHYPSDARRWILKQYLILRREGHTPLQAMLMVWQEADAMPPGPNREWRKVYARRYFMRIALHVKHNAHWRKSCLTTSPSS